MAVTHSSHTDQVLTVSAFEARYSTKDAKMSDRGCSGSLGALCHLMAPYVQFNRRQQAGVWRLGVECCVSKEGGYGSDWIRNDFGSEQRSV